MPSSVLQQYVKMMCEKIDELAARKSPPTKKFHTPSRPDISTIDFIFRCEKYFNCSAPCLGLAAIYIDRLLSPELDSCVYITNTNKYNILAAALVVAVKIHDDYFYSNSVYAKVTGLSLCQLNVLELELCTYLDFNLFVDTKTFFEYMPN